MRSLEFWMNQRLRWLSEHHYSIHTISGEKQYLKEFCSWAFSQKIKDLNELETTHLNAYQQWLRTQQSTIGKAWSTAYQSQLIGGVTRALRWAYRQGYLLNDPSVKIKPPRRETILPSQILSLKQLETLMKRPNTRTALGLRDRTMLEIFYATAIRKQELLNLKTSDIDHHAGLLYIRQGKGNKDRVVPINQRALKWIKRYELEVREKWFNWAKSGDTLILSEPGNPLSNTRCDVIVRSYLKKISPNIKGACHIIRHSVATLLMENGCDLRCIQEFLGHEDITSTQVYLHLSMAHTKANFQKFHPAYQE